MSKLQEIIKDHSGSISKQSRTNSTNNYKLYLGYRYLKRDNNFYIKKKYESDHEYAVGYKEWSRILSIYLKYVWKYLLTGRRFETDKIGHFTLSRYDATPLINWVKTVERGTVVRYGNSRLRSKYYFLNWKRFDKRVKFINYWTARIGRDTYIKQLKKFMKEPYTFHKLPITGKYAKIR